MTLDADAKIRLERAILLATDTGNISVRTAVAKAMVGVNDSARRIYLHGVLTRKGPIPSLPRVANPEFVITPLMRREAQGRELFLTSTLPDRDK
jgi:hypothetical protein